MIVDQSTFRERPAVLIIETEDERRDALSQGLADVGYEVIRTPSLAEGLKFAAGLGPSVIVGPIELIEEAGPALLEHCRTGGTMEKTLLVLGDPDDTVADALPDEVRVLRVDGYVMSEILRRIRLVLLGREIGVEADLDLRSLVGDLTLVPMLEIVRALNRCKLTGRLEVKGGWVAFERGDVIASRAGQARGMKAFCRLARRLSGPFRIRLEEVATESEVFDDVPELVLRALEEAHLQPPPLSTRIRVLQAPARRGPGEGSGASYTHQDLLLELVSRCETVGELLDGLPSTDGRVMQALEKLMAKGVVALERPRSGIAVVTDSTSDLPPELAMSHDVEVVPLSVVFGDHSMRDGVDIQPRDFYHMLESESDHPSTRPPAMAEFYEHYLALAERRDILSVHISSRLSETWKNAQEAAERGGRSFDLPPERQGLKIEVVDSRNVSMGVGLLALFAARMANRGEDVEAIARRLEAMTDRIHTLFVVDTLDFLVRGGRIGKARAWVGKLLGIKPILGVVDGEVTPIDRVRGGRQAHPRIVKLFRDRVDPARPVVVAVAHARAPVWADRLRRLLESSFKVAELVTTDIGPVVGTHAGPGCVGAVVIQPTAEEWELMKPLHSGREVS